MNVQQLISHVAAVIIFEPDKTPQVLRNQVRPPELTQMQKWIGGYVENVAFRTEAHIQCFVDEEGKLKGKEANALATALARSIDPVWKNDVLVGTVVFLVGRKVMWK